jgi:hypothetical protein
MSEEQKPCELCGWRGPRREREVNYSNEHGMWLCARCYFRE